MASCVSERAPHARRWLFDLRCRLNMPPRLADAATIKSKNGKQYNLKWDSDELKNSHTSVDLSTVVSIDEAC